MKKTKFVDKVRVESPCTERWDEMIGNDQVRFCSHCAKDVNNLSSLTPKQALRLVRKAGGDICIRYIPNPLTNAPLFVSDLVKITRRASRMAAGVISASLSLAAMSYAQDGQPREASVTQAWVVRPSARDDNDQTKSHASTASISGTITDSAGAMIPGVTLTLYNNDKIATLTGASSETGQFSLRGVLPGTYSLVASYEGFANSEMDLTIVEGSSETHDITLFPRASGMGGAMVAVEPEFKGELAKAVSHDDVDEARNLIAAGADINGREDDKTTPLFIAVENGDLAMVRLLLDFGAKLNAKNDEKETPLMKLDEDASKDLVEALIAAGAKVNAVSNGGNTPLILAASNAKAEVIQSLIDAGAELDAKNEDGETALMNAADADNLEAVKALVLAGANVNLKDNDGDTAWDKTSDDEIEDFLVAHGAIVEDKPEEPQADDDGGGLK